MKRHRIGVRCTAKTQRGDQCGRWCAPGEIVCAKHQPDAPLAGAAALSASDDPVVILKRLTKDRDPRIRLRAVNAYLARLEKKEKFCAKCAAHAQREQHLADFAAALTREERETFRTWYRDFREAVYARQPELRPAWDTPRAGAGSASTGPVAAAHIDAEESTDEA